jgi:chemotaxis protein methyltransferase WspC
MRLPEIKELLLRNMGLDSASVGTSTIERAVRERMQVSKLQTMDAYWERLFSSKSELQELIEAVVVPETWFFRDEETFAALVRLVAESLRNRPDSSLRVLSIPCSTGEEPYSIVMALRDGDVHGGHVTVDAVDISARALAHARRGVYGRNSFRSRDLAFRSRHFSAVAEGYAIAEGVSGGVTFHQGNLVSGPFPFAVAPYDVVFCRNLLIYFDRSMQERAMQTLFSLLAPGGILFVGPAEATLASSSGFTAMGGAASFAFCKTSAKRTKPSAVALPLLPANIRKESMRATLPQVKWAPKAAVAPVELPPSDLITARRLADQGHLREAADCCERNLSLNGPSAETYYLLGVVRDAAEESDRAADCYRRAVYLDPHHAEALTHLALFSQTQGDGLAVHRLRGRARRAGTNLTGKKVVTP